MNQLPSITRKSGVLAIFPISCNLRCPYQANVIKILAATSNIIVTRAFINIYKGVITIINVKQVAKVVKKTYL